MKPVNFDYARPKDVAAAVGLVSDDAATVKIMAGSQSLGPMLNMRLVQPDLVVDITGIDELRQIEDRADEIVMGACITHADIEDRRVPDYSFGALPTVANGIAYRAVRSRGTIGGSLTHADPSADWVSTFTAIGATLTIRGAAGDRTLGVEDFMLGALEADLKHGEMLVSVTVPKLRPGATWGYYKICRKTGEFAHAIGAFVLDPERGVARVVIGATETKPFLMTNAWEILGDGTPERFDAQAAAAFAEREGMEDPLERQTHVVALRRAVEQAATR